MNLFQWIALPILGFLFLCDLRSVLLRQPTFRRDRLIRCVIWLVAAAAIYDPTWTSYLANSIGIQRGADLVLYSFVLAFLGTAFHFYSRCIRLERQLTDLIRHIAIREAKAPDRPTMP